MKLRLFIFTLSIISCTCQAQTDSWEPTTNKEVAAVYQKACTWFINNLNYSFKLKYVSYNNHITSIESEKSDGYYKRVSNNFVTEAAGIKTIQNARLRVIVDTADKIVTIMNPGSLSPNLTTNEELETLLLNTKSLKKKKLPKGIKYRMEFNQNELFDAYEFSISEKGVLENLTYFYAEQTEKEDEEWRFGVTNEKKIKPRLEISFFNYEVPAKYKESEFSEQDVLSLEKERIDLKEIYKDFRLLDYRLKEKN